ncbi:UNVERIFIED_CONTAM: hypothetical protein H355_017112 [Colinus virginianus]|nr:hypothetical protein H355_017112 [Colinus virginianus]
MPKFYCDYCDTYLTHDSPSVRKTHCSGRKHKENVKDYYQKWMEEQAQSLIDKTTRENSTDTILSTTSWRSHDTTTSQHPWSPAAWHDAGPTHGWTTNDANDGPTPARNDACWTCSRDEAPNGRTHANDARASNDEAALETHDGANPARDDPSRQIKTWSPVVLFML